MATHSVEGAHLNIRVNSSRNEKDRCIFFVFYIILYVWVTINPSRITSTWPKLAQEGMFGMDHRGQQGDNSLQLELVNLRTWCQSQLFRSPERGSLDHRGTSTWLQLVPTPNAVLPFILFFPSPPCMGNFSSRTTCKSRHLGFLVKSLNYWMDCCESWYIYGICYPEDTK